jgi:membrane protease YdiL (CAAX protease family)
LDWRATLATIATTLILVYSYYHTTVENFTRNMVGLYFIVPILVIIFLYRESPVDYGFSPGNWKLGLIATVTAVIAITFLLPLVLRMEDFKTYYSMSPGPVLPFILNTAARTFGWEFFFRGFLLFALARVAGPYAILLQAVPFTLAHLGKPELETMSCIFGGSAFGWLSWRTKSFIYPFLIHTYLSVMVVLLAN